jgi:hypothetical protein
MINKENESGENGGFMQGGGFIALIIIGTTAILLGVKALFDL